MLVLAHSVNVSEGAELPEGLEPVGLLLITDVIRAEAPDTLAYFESQGVDLKVISGDDPVTVSAIARRAGLKNAEHYIDATTITTQEQMDEAVAEYSVFGRVTPQQKQAMVKSLQAQKHTVAMTGDGNMIKQLHLMMAGRLDGVVLNERVGRYLLRTQGLQDQVLNGSRLLTVDNRNFLGFTHKPGHDQLAIQFSSALKAFKQTPAYQQLLARYHL